MPTHQQNNVIVSLNNMPVKQLKILNKQNHNQLIYLHIKSSVSGNDYKFVSKHSAILSSISNY